MITFTCDGCGSEIVKTQVFEVNAEYGTSTDSGYVKIAVQKLAGEHYCFNCWIEFVFEGAKELNKKFLAHNEKSKELTIKEGEL